MRDALIALHFQNDICHPEGRIPFSLARNTPDAEAFLAAARRALGSARRAGWTIAHVHIGFAKDYSDLPVSGTLFNKARDFGAVQRGSWGVLPFDGFEPEGDDLFYMRNCNSGFRRTALEAGLRARGVERVNLMGMATQFSVEHTARDAVDLYFHLRILADCCRAADMDAHRNALKTLAMLGEVTTSAAVFGE